MCRCEGRRAGGGRAAGGRRGLNGRRVQGRSDVGKNIPEKQLQASPPPIPDARGPDQQQRPLSEELGDLLLPGFGFRVEGLRLRGWSLAEPEAETYRVLASGSRVIRIASGHSTKASLDNYFCRFIAIFLQTWGFVILQNGPRGPWSIAALVADYLQAGVQMFCRRPGRAEKDATRVCQWGLG